MFEIDKDLRQTPGWRNQASADAESLNYTDPDIFEHY
jgi:hypothetical protein